MTNLIVDLSGITHSARHTITKGDELTKGLIIHKTLMNISFAYNKYKAKGLLIACDNRNVWRREIYPEYKAQREVNRDEHYKDTRECIEEIQRFFEECTTVPVIQAPNSEADDVIAITTRAVTESHPNTQMVIMSDDRDFMQLIDNNVRLYSPRNRGERENEDKEYDLFVKCIRGDNSDNITSAYPFVRETRLKKAWEDKTEMINLMETVTKHGIHVGETFKRNQSLINFDFIPQHIEDSIREELDKKVYNHNEQKFDVIKTNQFYAKYQLIKLADSLKYYRDMFKSRFHLA